MAAKSGATPEHLSYLAEVAKAAKRYGVFPVLRAAEARAPGLPRIGDSRLPSQNIVDLNQPPHVAFPDSTLESIEIKGERAHVNGYWLGLTGPMGPLPLHLSEFALNERRYGQKHPFGRFLDMLAGRMLQFFYRAWADSQPVAHADRPDDDRFGKYLAALSGAGENVPADAAFPARARLHYASLFASHRSAAGVQDALTHLLGTPVRLIEFLPRWRDIEPGDRSRLGPPGGFNGLGADSVAGSSVRAYTDAYRVVVRARTFAEYESFLPTGAQFKIAAEALDAFTPSHLEWELEVELDEREARPARLDGRTRMGWTSWMAPTGAGGVRAEARLGRRARRMAGRL
jgi:type VI secretion system ImpH/TssG family protein